MKKFVLPIIIAAVLGVGGGVTAIMMNRSSTAAADAEDINTPADIEVKSGKYYLNGDKNSDLWIEVNRDFLILKGSNVDKSVKDAVVKNYEETSDLSPTDEEIKSEVEECKTLYCTEKLYAVKAVGLDNMPYSIKVSRDNSVTDRNELMKTNAGFRYNGKDTIELSLFGDFIFVE